MKYRETHCTRKDRMNFGSSSHSLENQVFTLPYYTCMHFYSSESPTSHRKDRLQPSYLTKPEMAGIPYSGNKALEATCYPIVIPCIRHWIHFAHQSGFTFKWSKMFFISTCFVSTNDKGTMVVVESLLSSHLHGECILATSNILSIG